jgi:hypothetical protein
METLFRRVLHLVCVEEIPPMPEQIEEAGEARDAVRSK